MKNKKEKEPSVFRQEVHRDFETFKRLSAGKKIQFIWDYYRYKILIALVVAIVIITAVAALYEGQRPCRLRVCAVLNNEESCKPWFDAFAKELALDGNTAKCSLNEDQPFDYANKYYYVQELEVMTTISSYRMDVAICGPDMYDYLLALNACLSLDQVLTDEELDELDERGMLVRSTAGLQYQADGTLDESNAVDGIFAIDISNTEFGKEYNGNQDLEEGEEAAPLYAVIIRNTDHIEDSVKLMRELSK